MGKKITLLIADNHKLMRETLKILISGMQDIQLIGEAGSGEEAILLAKKLSPDIILMDINMSPVNGFEATRKILLQNPSIKIIALSLNNKAIYAKNMLQLGAKGYITKTSSPKQIMDAINIVDAGGTYIDKDLVSKI